MVLMGKTKEEDYDRYVTTYGNFGDIRKIADKDEAKKAMKQMIKDANPGWVGDSYSNHVDKLIEQYHDKKREEYMAARDAGNLNDLVVSFDDFTLDGNQRSAIKEVMDNYREQYKDDGKPKDYTQAKNRNKKLIEQLSTLSNNELDALTRKSESILPKELNDRVKTYKALQELGEKRPLIANVEALKTPEQAYHARGTSETELTEERKMARKALKELRDRKKKQIRRLY